MDSKIDDPDAHLIRAIAEGDMAALTELYNRNGLPILNYLIRELNDRQLAEEVLQDVMLAVWKQADRFRGESRVRTWMFAIARLQGLKARARNKSSKHAALDESTISSDNDPHEALLEQAEFSPLIEALQKLPSDQREALEMIFYRNLTGAEAATLLNISINTLKSRLLRARVTLRKLLSKERSA